MNDLISREDAISAVRHAWAKGLEPSQYIEIIPAIDAIPIEWLEKQSNSYDLFIASALKETLKAWKIEQERRNG